MTAENDLVLIYYEQKPMVFARIEEILPDAKPDWYHVRLLLLQLPLQEVTWILRDIYINGEAFTMNGKAMRLEKVEVSKHSHLRNMDLPDTGPSEPTKAQVIAFNRANKR